ncbi:putative mitochondrial hypothetical protein [Leptomonas pyrrhocoris]|uniref:JmjC domain-containing protein n=1 Tax=Leptomonas pyrrhocoris TaxID=157538 RepID=A0A0N0DVX5_LEPPY|nr:putative mitochondrial hypothetical protein [Leptomonas pyrrhocoris]KPA80968.1 putative mitochondrial hypothetical protein [Leptomonas pyrrhocoris]|eukprot:XP_015659407.1 putative mitochondrial hypothetical protein [Leptomonas pyrrhocoris]
MQTWYRPHPYGIYPRGNAVKRSDIFDRLGTLSMFTTATSEDDREDTEQPYLELVQYLLSFLEVPDLCRLSRSCTGWYVLVHCTDAFKTAYTILSPSYMRFRGSWKETAVRGYVAQRGCQSKSVKALQGSNGSTPSSSPPPKKPKGEIKSTNAQAAMSSKAAAELRFEHRPVCVQRRFFCDQLFQAWMCTILPPYYHLHPVAGAALSAAGGDRDCAGQAKSRKTKRDAAFPASNDGSTSPGHSPQYTSDFLPVERCSRLSVKEFNDRFELPNIPVVITDVATEWPLFKILNGRFTNLSDKKRELVRAGCPLTAPLRCEYTNMDLEDYVHYATEQNDERPIYMFDAEFGNVLDVEKLYTVPEYFARDDFFSTMGARRPKHRWIIAGPHRGGSSFHVDPNYTNAWNANMTGRKRWLLFPPGANPPGCVPSTDMAEVATPVSLTEWLLNNYDASLQTLRHCGYECICEPGDIMFVPCGWWHSVINLEDSVAITQNYVSRSNLPKVVKFLRAMKGSISGIDEDADTATAESTAARQCGFAKEFETAMRKAHPTLMNEVEQQLEREHQEREKRRLGHLTLLDPSSEGFTFDF